MWRIVLRHESRLSARQPSVWCAVATIVLLLAAAGLTTSNWRAMERRAQAAAHDDESTRMTFWAAQIQEEEERLRAEGKALSPTAYGPRHATNIGHYSGKRYAMLPPPPLGALAVGDTDVEPSHVLVSVDSMQFTGQTNLHQPLWLRAGRFDPAFVITMILPLLLIASTSPLLASDREGVLPLLVAQGAPLGRLASVRTLVRGGPVLMAAVVSVVVIGIAGRPGNGGPDSAPALRLVLVALDVLAYGLFWLGLAASLDAHVRRPGTTTIALMATWLSAAVIVPALVHATAVTWFPVASRADLEEAAREVQQQVWSGSNERILSAFFDEHRDIDREGVGSLERFMIYQMRAVLETETLIRPLEERYRQQQASQAAFLHAVRLLSPAQVAQHAFEEAVGAGAQRRGRFDAQLADYVAEWRAFFVPRIYYRLPIRDLSETPRFRFVEERAADIVRAVAADISLLVLSGGVCVLMARRAYRHPRVF